jgi:hypothetical protein
MNADVQLKIDGTDQMGGHRENGPAPAPKGRVSMRDVSTKALTDALNAGFARCEKNGRPLDAAQQIDLMSAFFETFADAIIAEEGNRRG